jgi:hypothetical protein
LQNEPSVLFDAGNYSLSRWEVGGIGLRTSELADALSATCDVRVLAPDDTDDLMPMGAAKVVGPRDWTRALADADAVVFFDCPDRTRLEEAVAAGKLIVSENVAPLEHAEYPSLLASPDPQAAHREIVATYARQLAVSHHFLCRSDVERATLVANLCLAGRVGPADISRSRTLDHLVSLVPIGFSERSAAAARRAEPRHLADFLWTGGIWSFYDPMTFVRAVARCRDLRIPVTGAFLHAQEQPDNAALLAELRRETAALGLRDAMRFRSGRMAHDERDSYLLGARGLVCIGRPGVESQTCVRLRIRDTRLLGVPLIVDGHGATATEAARGAGTAVVLAEPTPERLADELIRLARDPAAHVGADEEFCYEQRLRGFHSWLTTASH